jgi:hypothetical protein
MFASAEWLDSPHVFPNGTVVALVHVEFDAMNIEVPKCPHNYPLCWTVTVTQAISDDFGLTWRHAREPPAHLVAAVPYPLLLLLLRWPVEPVGPGGPMLNPSAELLSLCFFMFIK